MKKWLSILGILAILATMVLATFRPQLRYFMAQLTAELHRRTGSTVRRRLPRHSHNRRAAIPLL